MENKYETLHDFVTDSCFGDWVLGRDPACGAYWQAYLKDNPDKAELIKQAAAIVLAFSSERGEKLSQKDKLRIWDNIQSEKSSAASPEPYHISKKDKSFSYNQWLPGLRIAASVAAIVVLCIVLYSRSSLNKGEVVQYATQYGEVQNITLPDGSAVVLNANSNLSFHKGWDNSKPREVKLTGEAFFNVTHQENHQKFLVKLTDDTVIEVLGTQFTATQRPHKTRVVLNEGKVKFSVTEETMFGLQRKTAAQEILQPRELLELSGQSPVKLSKKAAPNPEVYAAFQHNKLMFVDAPLTEVARVLKDTYGYQVVFSDPELGSRRYTGTVPFDKVSLLLTALEKLFHLKINQQGKQLEIT